MATRKDAQVAFGQMARAAAAAGMDVAGWQLEPGSKVNGISWRIHTPIGSSDLVGLPPYGHIGHTATEATYFLDGLAAAFESSTYAKRREA